MIQEYIQMRNLQQYNLEWFYNYFISQDGKLDFQNFQNIFNILNLNDILNYLDRKFELVVLTDKDNNFIKIVE